MKKGITLIELLVAMGILLILIGTTVISFRGYQRKQNLNLAAEEIKSALEEAINMSLTPQEAGREGYGVNLTANSSNYILFSQSTGGNHLYNAGDPILKNYSLKNGVTPTANATIFSTVPKEDAPQPYNPPLPYKKETYFDGLLSNPSAPNETITLQLSATETKSVIINIYTNAIKIQ